MDIENHNIHAPAHSTSGYKILPNASQHKEPYVAEMAAVMPPPAPLQCDALLWDGQAAAVQEAK